MPTNEQFDVLRDLDGRATRATLAALGGWDPARADPETPCAGWRLQDLVAHMTVQQTGFARAVRGEATEIPDWEPVRHDDPVRAYRSASDDVLGAFASATVDSEPALLPELAPQPLPIDIVVAVHLVDNAVHAWDVARCLGLQPELDEETITAALETARLVPDDHTREDDGAAFAHALPVPDGVSRLDQLLLLLGRDPQWSPGTFG